MEVCLKARGTRHEAQGTRHRQNGIIQTVRTLRIRIIPRAHASELVEQADGSWVARVKAPPVDGRANDELIRMVARRFGLAPSRVWIRSGAASRTKLVCLEEQS